MTDFERARLGWSTDTLQNLRDDVRGWLAEYGLWWATSVVAHALILSLTLLVMGVYSVSMPASPNVVLIDSTAIEPLPTEETLVRFDPEPQIEQPPEVADLTTVFSPTPMMPTDDRPAQGIGAGGDEVGIVDGKIDDRAMPRSLSPADTLKQIGPGAGPGDSRQRAPRIFGIRPSIGKGGRPNGPTGAPKPVDRAIALALGWLSRHQSSDGSWSLANFRAACKDGNCSGAGSVQADAAATALGVLPFLAIGQTHILSHRTAKNAVDYRRVVARAANWLITQQKADGDLSAGSDQVMYSHALATIALAELYALSQDKQVGSAAQRAVNFIVLAQDPQSGGWRYKPRERGDTSVTGWQIMALKSGQIAGLAVPTPTLDAARRYLKSVAHGEGGQFAYEPAGGVTPTMTAAGLLASQYLGLERNARAQREGIGQLMNRLPAAELPDCYYCYYATQVLHNLPGPEWDQWNRRVRRLLAESQMNRAGRCDLGSWDPAAPVRDAWGEQGGRLMVTALNCLTLQVYYRYLPLYQLDHRSDMR